MEKIYIKNYSNYYFDKDGNVYNQKTEKLMKQSINRYGYACVNLSDDDKKQRVFCIHRVLAEHYLENPNNYTYIEHIDLNKLNNKIENLKWSFSNRDCNKLSKTVISIDTDEIKDCIEFPCYRINSKGELFNKITGKKVIWGISKLGYHQKKLRNKDGIMKSCSSHRLVALHFIPNPLNKPFVDHIDRNPRNNDVSNLRWVNYNENSWNTSVNKNSKTGVKGVYKCKMEKEYRWKAEITSNGETITKSFKLDIEGFEKAVEWRRKKEEELHSF